VRRLERPRLDFLSRERGAQELGVLRLHAFFGGKQQPDPMAFNRRKAAAEIREISGVFMQQAFALLRAGNPHGSAPIVFFAEPHAPVEFFERARAGLRNSVLNLRIGMRGRHLEIIFNRVADFLGRQGFN